MTPKPVERSSCNEFVDGSEAEDAFDGGICAANAVPGGSAFLSLRVIGQATETEKLTIDPPKTVQALECNLWRCRSRVRGPLRVLWVRGLV